MGKAAVYTQSPESRGRTILTPLLYGTELVNG